MESPISHSPLPRDETSTGSPSNARAVSQSGVDSGSLRRIGADQVGVCGEDPKGVSGFLSEEEHEEDCGC